MNQPTDRAADQMDFSTDDFSESFTTRTDRGATPRFIYRGWHVVAEVDDNHRLVNKWESSPHFGILYTDFVYDAQNRLTHRTVDPVDFWTDSFSESFTYDAVGNRTSSTYDGSPTAYTPVTWNQYSAVGTISQAYDANRNLTNDDGGRSMVHDADDRLTSCTKNGVTTTYVYDWQNRLITRTVGTVTTRFIYRGWHVVAEVDDNYGVSRTYLHGTRTDEILAYIDAAGNIHYLCTDHQGSTVAVLDQSGVPEEFYFYTAFGMLQGNTSPMVNYLFTGREFEPSTGLYNYRNRYYHPEQGRFLQPDPIRFAGGDMNLYAYCGNDPVNFLDSSGLDDIAIGVQASAIVAGGLTAGTGIVIDLDDFWESGIYFNGGHGFGVELGICAEASYVGGDLEGPAGSVNLGGGPYAFTSYKSTENYGDFSRKLVNDGKIDNPLNSFGGGKGKGVRGGPNVSISVTDTNTCTLTLPTLIKIACPLTNLFDVARKLFE